MVARVVGARAAVAVAVEARHGLRGEELQGLLEDWWLGGGGGLVVSVCVYVALALRHVRRDGYRATYR